MITFFRIIQTWCATQRCTRTASSATRGESTVRRCVTVVRVQTTTGVGIRIFTKMAQDTINASFLTAAITTFTTYQSTRIQAFKGWSTCAVAGATSAAPPSALSSTQPRAQNATFFQTRTTTVRGTASRTRAEVERTVRRQAARVVQVWSIVPVPLQLFRVFKTRKLSTEIARALPDITTPEGTVKHSVAVTVST